MIDIKKRPQSDIVCSLIRSHILLQKQLNQLRLLNIPEADIEIEETELLDTIMDIIGFPKDNTVEFYWSLFDLPQAKKNLRVDYINCFSRQTYFDKALNLQAENVETFCMQLYDELDELILCRPDFFSR